MNLGKFQKDFRKAQESEEEWTPKCPIC
jgi:hypothetical protein